MKLNERNEKQSMNLSCFTDINKSTIPVLNDYYANLLNPLADINALMMVAWQDVLGLNYHIDDQGTLFVYGKFEGQFYGWGPPLGADIRITHIDHFLDFLDEINGRPSSILYLWKGYPLYEQLTSFEHICISDQGSEYLYSSESLASLSSGKMKSFKKKRDYFFRKYKPKTKAYSPELADDCLKILDTWVEQKKDRVPDEYKDKFSIEADVCRNAIANSLPMSGIIMYIDDKSVAFSLGGEHSKECFNCMFEKTDLSVNGLSIAVFSELGKFLLNDYPYINAGEDWSVPYLKKTKLKWQPINIQKSFQLSRNF
jgi:hypothetical protein